MPLGNEVMETEELRQAATSWQIRRSHRVEWFPFSGSKRSPFPERWRD